MDIKNEVFTKLKEFTPVQTKLLGLISIICNKNVKVRYLLHVIECVFDEMPYKLQESLDSLLLGGWISIIGDEIIAVSEVASALKEIDIVGDIMPEILKRLVQLTTITTNDDLRKKKSYVVMGYATLRYYQSHDYLLDIKAEDKEDFVRLALNVGDNCDLAGALGNVHEYYNLPVYKALEKAMQLVGNNTSLTVKLSLCMVKIANNVFDYDNCNYYLSLAKKNADNGALIETYIIASDVYLNQTLIADALYSLITAYKMNNQLHVVCNEAIILRMCNIFNILDEKRTCQYWLSRCPELSKYTQYSIYKNLVVAELYEAKEFADYYYNESILDSYMLYGYIIPYIYVSHSRWYEMNGYHSESISEYGSYMRTIRFLYGVTTGGDTVVYHSSKVMASLSSGIIRARSLAAIMIDLCPADAGYFSFGARVSQYLTLASLYGYGTHEKLCCAYAEASIEQTRRYIRISNEMLQNFYDIFGRRDIPSSIYGDDIIRFAYQIKIDYALFQGRFTDSYSLCNECLASLHGSDEVCYILAIQGYILLKLGESVEQAKKTWNEAIKNGKNVLEIQAIIADYAMEAGYLDIAIEIINEVPEKKKTLNDYRSYLTFAEVCSVAGMEEDKKRFIELAKESAHGSNYTRCLFEVSMLLEETQAKELLEIAVNGAEPDCGSFVDQDIAQRWYALHESKKALGQDADTALRAARRLYPGEIDIDDMD